jgi:hypothetical protein
LVGYGCFSYRCGHLSRLNLAESKSSLGHAAQ